MQAATPLLLVLLLVLLANACGGRIFLASRGSGQPCARDGNRKKPQNQTRPLRPQVRNGGSNGAGAVDSELLEGITHKGLRAVLAQVEVRRLLAAAAASRAARNISYRLQAGQSVWRVLVHRDQGETKAGLECSWLAFQRRACSLAPRESLDLTAPTKIMYVYAPLPASSVPQTCRARVVPPQLLLQERDPHQPEFLAAVKEVRRLGCSSAFQAPPRRATKATAPTCQRSNFIPTPKPALPHSWLRCKSLLTHHSPTAARHQSSCAMPSRRLFLRSRHRAVHAAPATPTPQCFFLHSSAVGAGGAGAAAGIWEAAGDAARVWPDVRARAAGGLLLRVSSLSANFVIQTQSRQAAPSACGWLTSATSPGLHAKAPAAWR